MAVFYLFGPAYRAGREEGAPMPVMLVLLGAVILLAAYLFASRRQQFAWLSTFLNIGSAVALSMLLVPAAAYSVSGGRAREQDRVAVRQKSPTPDIYYIVLDGYGRSDVLRDLYGFDNRSFIDRLEQRGFYVAPEAMSNYAQTLLSLASSLNMIHLQDVARDLGADSRDRGVLQDLIRNNRVVSTLNGLGYRTFAFSSGFSGTDRLDGIDAPMAPPSSVSEFENLLLSHSPLPPLFERLDIWSMREWQFQAHRDRIDYVFDNLSNLPRTGEPRFVFAHVVAPHPPFVFGPKGEPKTPARNFSFDHASAYMRYSRRQDYIRGYAQQAEYLSARVVDAISSIVAKDPNAVIVVQSDHGPGAHLQWDDKAASNMRERMSILNAYRVPPAVRQSLYAGISPVNTFRVLFRELFGTPLDRLPDDSYFSEWAEPYRFENVTAKVRQKGSRTASFSRTLQTSSIPVTAK